HRRTKKQEGGQIKEILPLILHKVEEHDRVLKEIREDVLMLNQMTNSHFMFIQLLESQMDQSKKKCCLVKKGKPHKWNLSEDLRCATTLTKVKVWKEVQSATHQRGR
ncbi:hypothetical protein H5410_061621, partial [Solanum commersonii]